MFLLGFWWIKIGGYAYLDFFLPRLCWMYFSWAGSSILSPFSVEQFPFGLVYFHFTFNRPHKRNAPTPDIQIKN